MSTPQPHIDETRSLVLPPEILGEIIDHLGAVHDLESLRALSQTSRYLLHYCRKRLFSSVALNDSNVKRFTRVVEGCPSIISNIRRLDLLVTFDSQIAPSCPLVRNLPRLVGERCRVLSLSLVFNPSLTPNWDNIPHMLKAASLDLIQTPNLTHLTVGMIRDFPVAAFLPCVNLVNLQIKGVSIRSSHSFSTHPLKWLHPPRLSSFSFMGTGRGTDISSMATLIHSRRNGEKPILDFSRLSSFTTFLTTEEDIDVAGMLLTHVEHLQTLTVSLVNQDLMGLEWMCSALSLRNLRCLNIENYYFAATRTNPVEGLCRLLNGFESEDPPHLEEIKINGSAGGWCSADSIVGALDDILRRSYFSALRTVVIKITVEPKPLGEGKGRGIEVLSRQQFTSFGNRSSVAFVFTITA